MRRLILIASFLIVSSAALAETLPPEAEQICASQCGSKPKVQFIIPKGDGPVRLQFIPKDKGGPALDVRVHEADSVFENVVRLKLSDDAFIGTTEPFDYGSRVFVGPYRDFNGVLLSMDRVPATLELLVEEGYLVLPKPQLEIAGKELTYTLRVEWKRRDSGLNPLVREQFKPSGGSTDHIYSGGTRGYPSELRTCSDCETWRKQWLKANPNAWKQEPVVFIPSDDYQLRSAVPRNKGKSPEKVFRQGVEQYYQPPVKKGERDPRLQKQP